jgi:Neprosin
MANETSKNPLIPFRDFIKSVRSAKHEDFKALSNTKVRDEDAFREQQRHVLSLYDGVDVRHSFQDAAGQVFDCVPVEQQPALRATGATELAKAPPPPPPIQNKSSLESPRHLPFRLQRGRFDDFGNERWCPPETVAIRRISLDEIVRFESLGHFLRRGKNKGKPSSRGNAKSKVIPGDPAGADFPHRYAVAYHTVDNFGGRSLFNVWNPVLSGSQIMSLSQQWYSGGSDQDNTLQTAEVGWQVCPNNFPKAGSSTVLFIFWTADNYQSTGAYNGEDKKFVRSPSTIIIGGALGDISVAGGAQCDIDVSYVYDGSNWHLYIDGESIGYYPASIYNGGQMSIHAQEIMCGGETDGDADYPPMGSGSFAAAGYPNAAYHRNISYYDLNNNAQNPPLDVIQATPACYTIDPNPAGDPATANWGAFFFFGGPGGP